MAGCCGSDQATERSKKIDRDLEREKKQLKRQVKVLLLGSGESGKSTFLKQMVIIHGRGEFTAEEQREYKKLIYQNIVNGMRILVDAREKLNFPWQDPKNIESAKTIFNCNKLNTRDLDLRSFLDLSPLIRDLWEDLAIQQSYEHRSLFQINDSCKYFFEHLSRVSTHDFVPTNKDILYCRKATRTITEHSFLIQRVPFKFVDVGGQRTQRQKWFQCFDGITSILFLVGSSEYDQVIIEDRKTNRILESREIFDALANNRSFVNVAIILFLNKTDLLTEKVPLVDIRKSFPDFKGDPKSVSEVQYFLLDLFESVRREKKRPLFYHFTTAVDTENIRRVFNDCREIILEQNLATLMMQ